MCCVVVVWRAAQTSVEQPFLLADLDPVIEFMLLFTLTSNKLLCGCFSWLGLADLALLRAFHLINHLWLYNKLTAHSSIPCFKDAKPASGALKKSSRYRSRSLSASSNDSYSSGKYGSNINISIENKNVTAAACSVCLPCMWVCRCSFVSFSKLLSTGCHTANLMTSR